MADNTLEPHELLVAEMERLGLGPVAFAKKIGVDYQTLARWRRGMFFNRENQELCAVRLGRPPDFFSKPDVAELLRRMRAEAFEQWVEKHNAEADAPLAPDVMEVLRRMAEADPSRVPSPEWFTVQHGVYKGNLSRKEAKDIVERNGIAPKTLGKSRRKSVKKAR